MQKINDTPLPAGSGGLKVRERTKEKVTYKKISFRLTTLLIGPKNPG